MTLRMKLRTLDVAGVIDARRAYACACGTWYPVARDLHRFFVAVSRAIVNDDGEGGTAPTLLSGGPGLRPSGGG